MTALPTGIILAGGLSRRMGGGDKTLHHIGTESLLARIVRRVRPQVESLLLNANGQGERFGVDLPLIPDMVPDTPGPLAGILAGLDHMAVHAQGSQFLLTVPSDCPFLPADLVVRLLQAAGSSGAAYAYSGERRHPVIGMWPVAARDSLRNLLVTQNTRRAEAWPLMLNAVPVEWPVQPFDPFFNINSPDDVAEGERLLASYPAA